MSVASFLIKRAVLWSTARPNLGWRMAKQQARIAGVPIKPKSLSLALSGSPAAYFPKEKNIQLDLQSPLARIPGAPSEVLQHELSEAKYMPSSLRQFSGVVSGPQKRLAGIAGQKQNTSGLTTYAQTVLSKNQVGHADPRVLLDESYRIASGQVSPQWAEMIETARKRTGEVQAMHRMGIAYGKSMTPPGSAAYERARQRFEQIKIPTSSGGALYNLAPISRKAMRLGSVPTEQQMLETLKRLQVPKQPRPQRALQSARPRSVTETTTEFTVPSGVSAEQWMRQQEVKQNLMDKWGPKVLADWRKGVNPYSIEFTPQPAHYPQPWKFRIPGSDDLWQMAGAAV